MRPRACCLAAAADIVETPLRRSSSAAGKSRDDWDRLSMPESHPLTPIRGGARKSSAAVRGDDGGVKIQCGFLAELVKDPWWIRGSSTKPGFDHPLPPRIIVLAISKLYDPCY